MFDAIKKFFHKEIPVNSKEKEEIAALLADYKIPKFVVDRESRIARITVKPGQHIRFSVRPADEPQPAKKKYPKGLKEAVEEEHEETLFYRQLCVFMDYKGKKESAIYQKAMIDKATFSRIRKGHIPNRLSVLRLAFVLELHPWDADTLLEAAGYAFNPNEKFDRFICFFLAAFQRGEKYKWEDLKQWCYELTGVMLEGIE